MDDLSEFLLARVAEDEAVAQAATSGPWGIWAGQRHAYIESLADSDFTVLVQSSPRGTDADIAHIARHDPARVLAECEAKRRIVGVVSSWTHVVVEEDCWYTCAAATEGVDGGECCDDARRGTGCDCGLEFRRRAILAPLALPHADHADYRDEWLP